MITLAAMGTHEPQPTGLITPFLNVIILTPVTKHYQVNPEPSVEKPQDPVGTSEDSTAIEDCKDQLITAYAAEESPLKVVEDDPTAIYALQAQDRKSVV